MLIYIVRRSVLIECLLQLKRFCFVFFWFLPFLVLFIEQTP